MTTQLLSRLQSLATWRSRVDHAASDLARWLTEHDLAGDGDQNLISALRERLASDKLRLAFVAEFSRGKSELINAIFFADAGRRILPATPGRTTMCPVELAWDGLRSPELALLPIETRLRGLTLADLRSREEPWSRIRLDPAHPEALAQALSEVTRTRRVPVEEARALGLWDDEHPDENPPLHKDGQVEVPAWRHALINYPHPLLQRGLSVLDTPGLNAIGAEPELTLNLLPSAHAVVFLLAADTGVTRSDLAVWRDHLGARALERFVVLNKIDALIDPLCAPSEIERQIETQRLETARTLEIDIERVFPVSARDALAGRLDGDLSLLMRSRLLALESALSEELMPRQQQMLAAAARETLEGLRQAASRRLADRRRQNAEEMLELRGLKGKSTAKIRLMLERVKAESAEFERCLSRLQALRSVHGKMQKKAVEPLASDLLRAEVAAMQGPRGTRILHLGAARSFAALMSRVRLQLKQSIDSANEMWQMMHGSFEQLNAEYGFSYVLAPLPELERFGSDLDRIEARYGSHLGLTQAWRLSAPGAMDHFCRMLLSRLRVAFETASAELEMWSKSAESQVEAQLRERRRMYRQRGETLQRIQSASSELESRIAELDEHEQGLRELHQQLDALVLAAQGAAVEPPAQGAALAVA
ncbi:MAG: dynamin family protein [Rubrivivax sp.]|nr:dynamin family protein [Rubrivivax sp.]